MKTLNLVICLLAVTISVACSKKKDGNGQPYGLTPNDPRYNNGYHQGGYPQQPIMPGYQMPTQGNCQGPSQMFPDLGSYCGWLARDGERMCNPMVVRQNFMQYCQSFATRLNYCAQEVRSGCFRTTQGCAVRVNNVWERYSQYGRRDKGDDDDSSGGQVIVGPIQPVKQCTPNPSVDCKRKNPKKKELHCKLPGQADKEENYVYDINDYKALACEGSSARSGGSQNKGVSRFARPSSGVRAAAPSSTVVAAKAPTTQQGVVAAAVKATVDTNQCLNIQEIHEYIIDQKNDLSSSAEYYQAELLEKNLSVNFKNAWKLAMKPILEKYSVSVYSRYSKLSAIGANISQNNKLLQVQKVADFGKIVSCNSGNQMVVKFNNEVGVQEIIFTQNGFEKNDSDFSVTETTRGVFKFGNETGTYLLARYIGVGKNLSEEKIQAKVIADMKRKNFIEADPESIINH